MTPPPDPPATASAGVERALAALAELAGTSVPALASGVADDLVVAARAVLEGGMAACRHYDGELEIEDKGRNDPVTEADHASNRAILGILGDRRPEDPILSEESRPPPGHLGAGRLWVVDPLDGTKEFIAHNGEFSIMVGLAVDGDARLGAVYQPAADLLFAGVAAGGAWIVAKPLQEPGARPLRLAGSVALEARLRFVRSRSHPDERLRRIAAGLGELQEVISGSVGIKCALVARGAADLYVHPVPFLKEWDTCAPEAILRGAGGIVTDCAGGALSYGKSSPEQPGGIFAGTAAAWGHARAVVAEVTAPLFEDDADDSET